MLKGILIVPAALLALAMIVSGLWAWQGASELAVVWDFARPDVAAWAIRSAAAAAIAGAQIVVLLLIARRFYRRGTFDAVAVFAAAAVCAIASVSAIAFGLAGR